jgi:hypothetical protein
MEHLLLPRDGPGITPTTLQDHHTGTADNSTRAGTFKAAGDQTDVFAQAHGLLVTNQTQGATAGNGGGSKDAADTRSDTNTVLSGEMYTSSTTGNTVYNLGLFNFGITGIRVSTSVGNDKFDLLT